MAHFYESRYHRNGDKSHTHIGKLSHLREFQEIILLQKWVQLTW